MNEFRTQFYYTILDIPRTDWESIWPNPHESYSFYLAQEKSHLEGFKFSYLVIYFQQTPVLIAPLFTADFNLCIGLEGIAQTITQNIQRILPRFMIMNILFCGSPVTEKGNLGIHVDYQKNPQLFAVFDQALMNQAQQQGQRAIFFKDFLDQDIQILSPLKKLGYFLADSYPSSVLPINFPTMDAYFSTLSRATRKDLKRKIKKTQTLGGVDIAVVNNIDNCADDIERLYLNIYNYSNLRFELLNKTFFQNICHHMPESTLFFLYRVNGKLIGFNYCSVRAEGLVDKFIGLDYEYSRKYNLYFISLLNNIQWCLENGKKNYFLSQNGYSAKTRLGAKLIPLTAMIKHVNPLMNKFFNTIVGLLEPKKLSEGPVIDEKQEKI